jgi:sugar phosphate isomerase/epimerase
LVAQLIKDLGQGLALFYAWQHGMGCHEKLPKEQELMQMPGRGSLDFSPILSALKKINYSGWTEIFMHPVPRGIPILDTAADVTDEINHARHYLDELVQSM